MNRHYTKLSLLAGLSLGLFSTSVFAGGDKAPRAEEERSTDDRSVTTVLQDNGRLKSFAHWSQNNLVKKQYLNRIYDETRVVYSRLRQAEEEGRNPTLDEIVQEINSSKADGTYNPYAPASIDIQSMHLAWSSAISLFMQNAPSAEGRYNAGYAQPIWNAFTKVALEQVVPMTPDGVVLSPVRDDVRLAVIQTEDTRLVGNTFVGVRLFLINETRDLLDQKLIPVNFRSSLDLNGNPLPDSGLSREFLETANLIKEYDKGVVALRYDPAEEFTNILASDNPTLDIAACFRKIASRNVDDVGACLQKAFKELGYGIKTVAAALKDGFLSGLTPLGSDSANGFSTLPVLDSFLNMINIGYNASFRQEDIAPADLKNMASFVASYSVTPNQFGEILNGQYGEWAYYPEQKMVRRVGKNDAGQYVLLDAEGKPVQVRLKLQVQEVDDVAFIE